LEGMSTDHVSLSRCQHIESSAIESFQTALIQSATTATYNIAHE